MARNSKLWDMLKTIDYDIGDIVVLNHKKSNGYPKWLDFGVDYFVVEIDNDFIRLTDDPNYNSFSSSTFTAKINKIYLLPKSTRRNIKIDSLLHL